MKFSLTGLLLLSLVAGSTARACNIPVFRYALERWPATDCRLVVFHDGTIPNAEQQTLEAYEQAAGKQGGLANVEVTRVDVANADSSTFAGLWATIGDNDVELPYLVCQTLMPRNRWATCWRGPLATAQQANLLQSPVRQELVRRILAGDAVVWLLMESANADANDQVEQRLRKQLQSLSTRLELPQGIGMPGSELHSEVPLLLQFSVLRFDPNDPAEQYLSQLFAAVRPQVADDEQPLVVPVFGRGRALEVIPASAIDTPMIEELSRFMSGACSCQVKELNPGFDLLISLDWNRQLFGDGGVPPTDQPSFDRRQSPVLLTIPPGRGK